MKQKSGTDLLQEAIRKLFAEGKQRSQITQMAMDQAWKMHQAQPYAPRHQAIKY